MKTTLSVSIVIALTFATGLSAQTMGYKLAVIEKKGYVSENDPLVKRFENIITQLDLKYIENKEQIGDKTVTGKNQLERVGIKEPMINIMEGISRLEDIHTKKKQYGDYVACYVIFRSQGFGHLGALERLQLLLKRMSMEDIKRSLGG